MAVAESDVVRNIGPQDSTAVVEELGVDGLDLDLPNRKRSRNVGVPAREDILCAFSGGVKSEEEGLE